MISSSGVSSTPLSSATPNADDVNPLVEEEYIVVGGENSNNSSSSDAPSEPSLVDILVRFPDFDGFRNTHLCERNSDVEADAPPSVQLFAKMLHIIPHTLYTSRPIAELRIPKSHESHNAGLHLAGAERRKRSRKELEQQHEEAGERSDGVARDREKHRDADLVDGEESEHSRLLFEGTWAYNGDPWRGESNLAVVHIGSGSVSESSDALASSSSPSIERQPAARDADSLGDPSASQKDLRVPVRSLLKHAPEGIRIDSTTSPERNEWHIRDVRVPTLLLTFRRIA